jgi:hypothetical protein
MLDDARFFVEGFIKGLVCRGQVALNVINDHFFVVFFDPEKDTISNDTRFLSEVSDLLGIPSERKSTLRLLSTWHHYAKLQKEYLVAKEKDLMELNPDDIGNDISYVWDGDGINPNALLTVIRHFDSASVVNGFVGKMPKTGWVIDYPLFERIHYLLVAGFNVYGNVGHQLETRLYMDFLRLEGENNFLSFLPISSRREIWADWYTDARKGAENYLDEQFRGLQRTTRIKYHTDDPKTEFFHQLIAYAGKATDTHDISTAAQTTTALTRMLVPRKSGPTGQCARWRIFMVCRSRPFLMSRLSMLIPARTARIWPTRSSATRPLATIRCCSGKTAAGFPKMIR